MKFKRSELIIGAYVIAIFYFSAIEYKYAFFNDVKDYIKYGHEYSNSSVHRFLLATTPNYYFASSLIALYCVLSLIRKINWQYSLPLLHPYYLLLIFSASKEQLIFIGLFYTFFLPATAGKISAGRYSLVGLFAPLLTMRAVYLPFFFLIMTAGRRHMKPVLLVYGLIAAVAVMLALLNQHTIQWGLQVLHERATFTHVGRDYFPGLCLAEKADGFLFLGCWALSRIGVVMHEQILSINYIIHLGFLMTFWWLIYLLIRTDMPYKTLIIIGVLGYHFLGSWWGPVQGASERYFSPILWCAYLAIFARVIKSGVAKRYQVGVFTHTFRTNNGRGQT